MLPVVHLFGLVNHVRGDTITLTASLIPLLVAVVKSVLRALCNPCVALMRIEVPFSAPLPCQDNLSGLHSIVFSLTQFGQSLQLLSTSGILFWN